MLRIMHIISDLGTGGAQVMLTKLLGSMDRQRFVNSVVSLTGPGELGENIESLGVSVHYLGMKRGRPNPSGLPNLIRLLKAGRPDLVQSWLYHADFLALIAARFAGSPPVVWNLRCSDMDLGCYPPLTRWIVRALALLSRRPAAIVVNSLAGKALHERLKYRPRHWQVIPNGFDLERFQPNEVARQQVRAELNVPADRILVGLVARVDPMKDHGTFLAAAGLIARKRGDVHFVLAGMNTPRLEPMIREHGLAGRAHLLGARCDVERLLPAIDICCLSSAFGEGFPNVLGEAMASGVPCVATDVGDAALLLGGTGKVVPPRNPQALADACAELIALDPGERQRLGQAARRRIKEHYDLTVIVKQYERFYDDLALRRVVAPCAG